MALSVEKPFQVYQDTSAIDTTTYTVTQVLTVHKDWTFTPETSNNVLMYVKLELEGRQTGANSLDVSMQIVDDDGGRTVTLQQTEGDPVAGTNMDIRFTTPNFVAANSSWWIIGEGSHSGNDTNVGLKFAMGNSATYSVKVRAKTNAATGEIKNLKVHLIYADFITTSADSGKFA